MNLLLPGRFRWIWLLIASVGYYLSFIPIFLPLMAAIVAINYLMAKWMGKASPQNSRNRLIAIVGVNVLILAFFKYFNFFSPYLLFLSKIAQGSIGRSGQLIPQQCKIMNDFIL